MDTTDDTSEFDRQVAELYRAIGEFAVQFEHVTWAMQLGVISLLTHAGLRNQAMAQVVVADLTAAPLASMYQSLVAEARSLSDDERRICDAIFKRTKALIETRNDVIHSTWFVGWASSKADDVSRVDGQKQTRGKRGSDIKQLVNDADGFKRHAQECDYVAGLLRRLFGLLLGGRDLALHIPFDRVTRPA